VPLNRTVAIPKTRVYQGAINFQISAGTSKKNKKGKKAIQNTQASPQRPDEETGV
jgi:hypothetical protein